MKSNNLVFFGTGAVSTEALEALARRWQIEALITKPDVLTHNHVHILPVKQWASIQKVPVHQPASGNELTNLFAKHKFKSQVGVVVDYGVLIPQSIIESFPKGILNVHYSLLPKYRGADPVRAALVNGDTETGVSIMLINDGLDTGDLLTQASLPITHNDDVGSLYQKLQELGNKLLLDILPAYLDGKIIPKPQAGDPTYAGKLSKESGAIDWRKPAAQIEREIRAYLGWPGSTATLGGKDVTITEAHVVKESGKPGKLKTGKNQLIVYTGNDALEIVRLKPAGKAEMSGADFGRGYL